MFRNLITLLAAVLAFNVFAAVDVNKANQAELQSIKGIGPGVSGKILAERDKGEFKNWADLVDRVKGVGPGNAGRFSEAGLTVGSATYTGMVAKADAKSAVKSDTKLAAKEAKVAAKEPKAPKAARATEPETAGAAR